MKKAIIMAGGEGTRLRPITASLPKPLVPIAGEPVIKRILRTARAAGVEEAALTLRYLGEKIAEVCGNECEGVKISCFTERKPLGTAGGVRQAAGFVDGDFLVMSGDAVCTFDLRAAEDFHRAAGADVTIVTAKVSDPLEFGAVLSAPDGRVLRFIEKPAWAQAFSDRVNTGIYIIKEEILERIPEGKPYDFSRDLFPALLSEGARLFAFPGEGDWCDIGDLAAFYRCNFESVPRGAENVVGQNCKIAPSASVTGSILFDGVTVGEGCVVDGAILCGGVTLGRRSIVRRGCVVGEGSVLGEGISVGTNVKIWNDKYIKGGITVMRDLVFGEAKDERALLSDSGLAGERSAFEPEYCVKVGRATAEAAGRGRVGILRAPGAHTRLLRDALLCGLSAGGARTFDFGEGFESMAAFAASRFRLDLMLFAGTSADGGLAVTMFDSCGLYPGRVFERSFAAAMARPDSPAADEPAAPETIGGLRVMYMSALTLGLPLLGGLRVTVNGGAPAEVLADALRLLGANLSEPSEKTARPRLFITVNEAGDSLVVRESESPGSLSFDGDLWHAAAVIELAELSARRGETFRLALPYTAPTALAELAQTMGAEVLFYSACPADTKGPATGEKSAEAEARETAATQLWLRDACFAATKICAIAAENGGIRSTAARIPAFYSLLRHHPDGDAQTKTRLLSSAPPQTSGDGVLFDFGESGRVRVIPRRSPGFTLFAEARTAEAAEEIMSLSESRLRELGAGGGGDTRIL